tara:strand:- start:222 stop:575 length:354 start_codon:yes stop_codon:yes gene_type:complete
MTDTSAYPVYPHRPNFTDIRTMQIFDPIVADTNVAISNSTWELLHTGASGITLENGVRVKNLYANSANIFVATTSSGTAGTGFQLGQDEEIFIEVRCLHDLWVKASANNGSATYIAS